MFSAKHAPLEIGVLIFDGFQLLDAAGPISVFEMPARGITPSPYRLTLYSFQGGPVRASSGVQMHSEKLPPGLALDTLIVSGGEGTREAMSDEALLNAIRALSERTRRTCSVCSGAFLLAAAGLLEGRRATTHWRRSEGFARLYPGIHLDADRIFVRDGKFWTSAGITAGIDLALALVEDDLGDDVALRAARELVVHQRRHGGQSQFSVMQDVKLASGRFDEMIGWIRMNLPADIRVETMAEQAGMSPRNFARVFRTETGTTPARFVEKLRLEAARQSVETTRLPLQKIATDTGFCDPERMRVAFVKAYGQPPMVLRRQSKRI
ncbi:putative transcriptional regulator DarR [Hyphomonas neptunium ATCC 15444]|uniref:Putative transcriptional regulator DarR n=2 Tax=Hyphomonas TaxID=85 RepID=Q0C0T9_HYPNA|nr:MULTISPECIES: helix-turn-helix domain-containing protein [Hyphomonas]ABI77286.1 putative transcriptional regulator DarR [Hyphomonas neptunium ATCC 15444]KCZ88219.1 putative transcriptional regulator DarR [Hyphomonas hirschiana VP5]